MDQKYYSHIEEWSYSQTIHCNVRNYAWQFTHSSHFVGIKLQLQKQFSINFKFKTWSNSYQQTPPKWKITIEPFQTKWYLHVPPALTVILRFIRELVRWIREFPQLFVLKLVVLAALLILRAERRKNTLHSCEILSTLIGHLQCRCSRVIMDMHQRIAA